MNVAIAKDGVVVTMNGNIISVSNGEIYSFCDGLLVSSVSGFTSIGCRNVTEAFGIVLGLHGGRSF